MKHLTKYKIFESHENSSLVEELFDIDPVYLRDVITSLFDEINVSTFDIYYMVNPHSLRLTTKARQDDNFKYEYILFLDDSGKIDKVDYDIWVKFKNTHNVDDKLFSAYIMCVSVNSIIKVGDKEKLDEVIDFLNKGISEWGEKMKGVKISKKHSGFSNSDLVGNGSICLHIHKGDYE
jgi:hypothetical protein